MTNRSRTEGLSFYLQKPVANEHIKQNIIVSVGSHPSTKELIFTFKDGTVKKFPRQSSGTSQASVVMVNSATININGELIVGLTNGELYNFGVITRPENFDNYTGMGIYVGGMNPLVFKPFLAGQGVTVDGNKIIFEGLSEVDPGFDGYALFTNLVLSGTATAGAFRNRTLTIMDGDLTGTSLNSSVIRLPKGKYYTKGWVKTYRTNYLQPRLFNVSANAELIRGMVSYSQANGGYNAESHASLSGYFVLPEDSNVVLQAYFNTSYSSPALVAPDNLLELWKVSS